MFYFGASVLNITLDRRTRSVAVSKRKVLNEANDSLLLNKDKLDGPLGHER